MTSEELAQLIKLDTSEGSYNSYLKEYNEKVADNLQNNKVDELSAKNLKDYIDAVKLAPAPENLSEMSTYTSIQNRLHYVPGESLNLSAAVDDFKNFIKELSKNTIKDLKNEAINTAKEFGKSIVDSFIPRLSKKNQDKTSKVTRVNALVTFEETINYAKEWFDRVYKIESQGDNKNQVITETEGNRQKWYFGKIRDLVEIKSPSQMFHLMSTVNPLLSKHQYALYLENDVLDSSKDKNYGMTGFRVQNFTIPKFSRKVQNIKYGYSTVSLIPELSPNIENTGTIEIIIDRNLQILKRLYDITGNGMKYSKYYNLNTIGESSLFSNNLTAFLTVMNGRNVNYASNVIGWDDNKDISYSDIPIFIFDNFKIINVDSPFKFSTKSQDSYKIKVTVTWTRLRVSQYIPVTRLNSLAPVTNGQLQPLVQVT